jgi:hypothetical protein
MSRLNQILCRFVPLEDRLLLRISTTDRHEFRFWMTRRFVKLLWPVLGRMLASTPVAKTAGDPQSRQAILAFQHETVLSQSNFSQPFDEGDYQRPLGDTPVLLARIQLKEIDGGGQILCLHPETGNGVEIILDVKLLHGFARLVDDAVSKADWDVSPLFAPATPALQEQVVLN